MLDRPNDRSSHSQPTPRGGGLAIVFSASAAILALACNGTIELSLTAALLVGGAAVAWIGFVDDRSHASIRVRLMVHGAAAAWALFWLSATGSSGAVGRESFGWLGLALGLLVIVWSLNLFNFMDGIDGIAASEAAFVAGGGCALALYGGHIGMAAASLAFAAACCGFLVWNWPPAKIFMGDAGSGYIGFVVAVLALAGACQDAVALRVWLILGGVFAVDATVTLVRRLLGGQAIQTAHRSHAYQRLSRRWRSHRRVTIGVWIVNLFWLLPLAVLATLWPQWSAWLVAVALLPLILIVIAAGAGKPD